MVGLTDEELLTMIRDGQPAALEALIYRYHAPIRAYLTRVLHSASLAEDLTQECFTRVITAAKTGKLPGQARPWIYRIATNLCKDLWKKSSYRHEQSVDPEKLTRHQDHETVASILERQWEREAVIDSLQALQEDNRQIVILRYYHELKLEDIADIMGMPLNTLKSRLYQSLKKLAQLLQAKEEGKEDGRQEARK